MNKIFTFLFSTVGLFSMAQLQISAPSTTYTVDFDATVAGVNNDVFAGSGFDSAPTAGMLNSDGWTVTGLSDGDSNFGDSNNTGDFARGTSTGSVGTGGIYAFEVQTGSYALGVQPGGSDFTPGTITLKVENNTGDIIGSIDLAYQIWVLNDQGRANSLNFSYSFDDVTYTDVTALDFTSTEVADGTPVWTQNDRLTTLSNLALADGDVIYFRWTGNDESGSGSRDEFAIDNITVSAELAPVVNVVTPQYVVDETTSSIYVDLELSNSNGTPSVVKLTVVQGPTADSLTDYTMPYYYSFDGTADGIESFTINILDDVLSERTEYFGILIEDSSNVAAGDDHLVSVYIKDDEFTAPVANESIGLQLIDTYAVASGSTEISAFDSTNNYIYVANSVDNKLEILDATDPYNTVLITSIDVSTYGNLNSVAVYNGIVALAMANSVDPQADGFVVFYDVNSMIYSYVTAGANPDMVVFTPDHTKVLVANEGEPNDDYTVDPVGSVSIIDISAGVTSATVTTAGFTAYDGQEATLRAQGVRIYGPGASASMDFEPEYITVSDNSQTAWITLQENNAIAKLDISSSTITDILPLGVKDYMQEGNAMDVSNESGEVLIANWPVYGMYLPDAISHFEVGGNTYLVTANEGDSRDYTGYSEEKRIKSGSYELDATTFGNALEFYETDENSGRLKTTLANGDIDSDGDYDSVFVYGTRSFSIWDENGNLVWDSGDDFEQIVNADPVYGSIFNASNDNIDFKDRSDDKGPEPEGITVGTINDTTYAFITLERVGGIMVYDVTDVANPKFVNYVNNRDVLTATGDLGPEGIAFIDDISSPIDTALLVVSNEVSGTVSIFKLDHFFFDQPNADFAFNPDTLCEGETVSYANSSTGIDISYAWTFDGGTPSSSTDEHPTVSYPTSGNYEVKLVVTNPIGWTDSLTFVDTVVVNPVPTIPTITQIDGATIESSTADYYQWNDMSGVVTGETNQTYAPSTNGDYFVTVTNAYGCSSNSLVFAFVNSVGIEENNLVEFKFYPNPVTDVLYFNINVDVKIIDLTGKVVMSEMNVNQINVSELKPGVYFIQEASGEIQKFVKR